LELTTEDGKWRVHGADEATLELDDWEIRIVESGVAVDSTLPILEKLVLKIVNVSVDRPLVLEPEEITIQGFGGDSARLGPPKRVVLEYEQSIVLKYTPGLRAPMLPHPFILRVTVFRGEGFRDPRTATITMY
jgi:hypothetical protein